MKKLFGWVKGKLGGQQVQKKQERATSKQMATHYLTENKYFGWTLIEEGHKPQPLREEEWLKIIENKSLAGFKRQNIFVSMLRGIPNHLRLELWPILAEVQQLKEKKQFEYQGHTGEEDNPCAKQIEMDVRRTYRGTTFQRAENVDRLRRILLAFARLDPEVGYVQGMNIIVAQLMMLAGLECEDEIKALLISPEQEETLFWLFASLMLQRNYRTMFLTGMVGLQEELAELEKAVAKIHPKLMAHWNQENVCLAACFTHFYVTLLLVDSPRAFASRTLDILLFEESQRVITSILLKLIEREQARLRAMTFAETMHWSRHVWQDREEESEEEWGRRSTFRSMMLNYYNFEAI